MQPQKLSAYRRRPRLAGSSMIEAVVSMVLLGIGILIGAQTLLGVADVSATHSMVLETDAAAESVARQFRADVRSAAPCRASGLSYPVLYGEDADDRIDIATTIDGTAVQVSWQLVDGQLRRAETPLPSDCGRVATVTSWVTVLDSAIGAVVDTDGTPVVGGTGEQRGLVMVRDGYPTFDCDQAAHEPTAPTCAFDAATLSVTAVPRGDSRVDVDLTVLLPERTRL